MRVTAVRLSIWPSLPIRLGLLIAAAVPLASATGAGAATGAAPAMIAWDRPETQTNGPVLNVISPAIHANAAIPQTYSGYGKNISPPMAWSGAPAAARSYVLMVEDPDSENPRPAVHWMAYNIPGTVKSLARGARNTDEPTSPLGMLQGWNYHGSVGYSGPRPPVGDPAHHYHFEVFALDRVLRLRPGAQPGQVIRAMSGRVVARGQLVATYAEPAPKPDANPSPDPS